MKKAMWVLITLAAGAALSVWLGPIWYLGPWLIGLETAYICGAIIGAIRARDFDIRDFDDAGLELPAALEKSDKLIARLKRKQV